MELPQATTPVEAAAAAAEEAPRVLTVCLNPTLQRTVLLKSRLRPGDVNRADLGCVNASGKGVNVTRVLVQLGVPALHLCQAHPESPNAARFLSLAAADGVRVCAVDSGPLTDVRCCTTLLDEAGATEVAESGSRVPAGADERVLSSYTHVLDTHSASLKAVVISGSKAPGFSDRLFAEMTKLAKARGLFVLLDVRGADLKECLPCRPDVVKPNKAELCETFFAGRDAATSEVADCMKQLWAEYGTRAVVTRGAEDTLYVGSDGLVHTEPVVPLSKERVRNPIGCGDSFAAAFAAAAIEHKRDDDSDWVCAAVKKGHEAASLNIQVLQPGSLRA